MNNSSKKSQYLILGFFFLFFATKAYVLFGTIGKYFSLLLGIILVCVGSIKNNSIIKLKARTILNVIVYFIVLLMIAFLRNQNTTSLLVLTFDLVCLLLFVFGLMLGSSDNSSDYPFLDIKLIKVIISLLVIIGAYKLYIMQASSFVSSTIDFSRHVADETLNPNGIAYSEAQLLLLFFWFVSNEKKNSLKIFFILGIISILIVMLMTESRGALIFVILTVMFFYMKKLSFKKLFFLSVIFFISFHVLSRNMVFQEKFELFINRFESAIDFANGNKIDGSLEERKELQSVFFNHFDEMLLGYENYVPYPHNQFIEIFMRWGVIGLLIFIISIRSILVSFVYKSKISTSSVDYLIVSIFFFTYIQSMSSLSLDNNRFLWFGFGFLLNKNFSRK